MSSAKPIVLVLSLSRASTWEQDHTEQIAELSKEFSIIDVHKIDKVPETLAKHKPQAVIMTDPKLASPKHRRHPACGEVVEYVHNGGRAIMAGYWSTYIKPADINTWFGEIWRLPWQNGDYSRQPVNLNLHSSHLSSSTRSLLISYSQKAVFLANVTSDDGLYWALDEQQDCPVALTKIGKGYIGYIGDVNGEAGSQIALSVMCGP